MRLRPREGVDVSFRARRGDVVMLEVRSRTYAGSPCFGTQTLRDGRGTRSARISGVGSAKVVTANGYAESLRAREHRVTVDGPAITLPAEPGREHVLVYATTPEDETYVVPQGLPMRNEDPDDPTWHPWRTYSGGADRTDPSLRRTVVAGDPDGAEPQALRVRVRRTVRVADLVVGGAPVTFASAEPGTRFIAAIPASAAGSVRLTASEVSTNGMLFAVEPHELRLTFAPDATGSVTLTLTDVP